MPGDRTQYSGATPDAPVLREWYVVTGGGASALRISPGLTVGESDAGALALNDPEARHQWIEFVLSDDGDPWVAIITRDKSLQVDGATHMRHQLTSGAVVRLPSNTLYINHDIRMPAPAGVVVEVVARDVPGRPQDLVGPGWEEALAAVRDPAPAEPELSEPEPAPSEPAFQAAAMPGDDAASMPGAGPAPQPAPPDPDRTEIFEPRQRADRRAFAADAPTEYDDRRLDDIGITMAEPRPGRRYRRRPRRGRQVAAVLASIAVVAVALAAVAAVLFTLSNPEGAGIADPASALLEEPAPADQRVPEEASALEQPGGLVLPEEDARSRSALAGAGDPEAAGAVAAAGEETAPAPDPADPATAGPAAGDALVQPAIEANRSVAGIGSRSGTEPPPAGDVTEPPVSGDAAPADATDTAVPETTVALIPRADPASEAAAAEPGSAPAVETPEPRAAVPPGPPDWRLVRARELLDSGYITFPPEDNAVAYLERLLAVDPGNPRALAMLDQCTTRLIDAAVRAHDQGMEYQARNTLEEVLGFDPSNEQANTLWREWVGSGR